MDGVGASRAGRRDQLLRVQVPVAALQAYPRIGLGDVRRAGIRIGVDGDGADPETTAGGEHPARDLAAVGDQHSCDHRAHIRKTPKFDVPLIGRIGDGGHAHSQHGAGVARIDHTVVVEHPGQHHGQRLGLDLPLDRGPHRGVGVLVHLLAAGFGRRAS